MVETAIVDDKSAHWETWKQLWQEAVATSSIPFSAARSSDASF